MNSETTSFQKIAIIGIGGIAASIARDARRLQLVGTISAYDINMSHLEEAKDLGLIDDACHTIEDALHDADLVLICIPPGEAIKLGPTISAHMQAGAILSDICSVKVAVITAIKPSIMDDIFFVPSHPVAGTENSGPSAGIDGLFEQRYCIITPIEDPRPSYKDAVQKLKEFWQGMGAITEEMDPQHHDRVLAFTSHLPHLLSYAIVGTGLSLEERLRREQVDTPAQIETPEVIRYSAGGLRDFTRIAASNPVMWRDVFLFNRDSVLEMLVRFSTDLSKLQQAVMERDGEMLEQWFSRTREARQLISEYHQAGTFNATEQKKLTDE